MFPFPFSYHFFTCNNESKSFFPCTIYTIWKDKTRCKYVCKTNTCQKILILSFSTYDMWTEFITDAVFRFNTLQIMQHMMNICQNFDYTSLQPLLQKSKFETSVRLFKRKDSNNCHHRIHKFILFGGSYQLFLNFFFDLDAYCATNYMTGRFTLGAWLMKLAREVINN